MSNTEERKEQVESLSEYESITYLVMGVVFSLYIFVNLYPGFKPFGGFPLSPTTDVWTGRAVGVMRRKTTLMLMVLVMFGVFLHGQFLYETVSAEYQSAHNFSSVFLLGIMLLLVMRYDKTGAACNPNDAAPTYNQCMSDNSSRLLAGANVAGLVGLFFYAMNSWYYGLYGVGALEYGTEIHQGTPNSGGCPEGKEFAGPVGAMTCMTACVVGEEERVKLLSTLAFPHALYDPASVLYQKFGEAVTARSDNAQLVFGELYDITYPPMLYSQTDAGAWTTKGMKAIVRLDQTPDSVANGATAMQKYYDVDFSLGSDNGEFQLNMYPLEGLEVKDTPPLLEHTEEALETLKMLREKWATYPCLPICPDDRPRLASGSCTPPPISYSGGAAPTEEQCAAMQPRDSMLRQKLATKPKFGSSSPIGEYYRELDGSACLVLLITLHNFAEKSKSRTMDWFRIGGMDEGMVGLMPGSTNAELIMDRSGAPPLPDASVFVTTGDLGEFDTDETSPQYGMGKRVGLQELFWAQDFRITDVTAATNEGSYKIRMVTTPEDKVYMFDYMTGIITPEV